MMIMVIMLLISAMFQRTTLRIANKSIIIVTQGRGACPLQLSMKWLIVPQN